MEATVGRPSPWSIIAISPGTAGAASYAVGELGNVQRKFVWLSQYDAHDGCIRILFGVRLRSVLASTLLSRGRGIMGTPAIY
ncbi:hypothetical protein BDV06DRAFT_160266 [Aspergillus oleicola]